MDEHIKRKAVIGEIEEWYDMYPDSDTAREALSSVKRAVRKLPAADVRPVVLCKDCLHYEMGACLKIYDDGAANKDAWQERKPEDFCSYGEKRKGS